MLKRLISLFLCAVMVISMLPVQAVALETEPEPTDVILATEPAEGEAESAEEVSEPAEEEIQPTEESSESAEPELIWLAASELDSEELLLGFLNPLYHEAGMSFFGSMAGERLSDADRHLYEGLKERIQQIAGGEEDNTKIKVDFTNTACSGEDIDIDLVQQALMHDLPFEMYWYSGCWYGTAPDYVLVVLRPNAYYMTADFDPNTSPYIDKSKTASAAASAENICDIRARYETCSDYDKLAAYADEICALVEYDHTAAETDSHETNINPWTLINVFDGDLTTNVVCEGYAEAFQYLCDESIFDGDVSCYSVTGNEHKWNIVRIEDVSYLMDVTHCDYGIEAYRGPKFLGGGSGSIANGYEIGGFHYWYYDATLDMWGTGEDSILKLSATRYTPPEYYAIVYDANGGSGAPDSQRKTQGIGIALRDTVPTWAGYTFLGWAASPTATAADYQPGDVYLGDGDVVLYAVWEKTECPHSFGGYSVTKEPSCTEPGSEESVCSLCGECVSREIPAAGHSHESVVTAPTCTEQGYTTYTCECGDSYVADYVDATGHAFENGICTACGAEHPNLANYKGKVISILGDSISTFAGYIPVADGFNLEHLSRYPDAGRIPDVTAAEQTWWMQVVNGLDAKLGINDSWRGAMVSGAAAVTTGSTGPNASMANLQRIRNLGANGTPDVILFYGGTNDYAHLSAIGTFDPATAPAEVDLTTTSWNNLADAYVQTLLRLRYYYPDAVIVSLLPTYTASYYSDTKLAQGNAVLAEICAHYGIPCLDLRSSGVTAAHLPDGIHPGAEGMDLITEAVVDLLLSQCDLEAGENVVYPVTHDLSGASASLGYFKGVTHGSAFSESLTGDALDVTVTMGGMDITDLCYADGKITIPSVTGDLTITAKGRFNADGHLQQLPDSLCCGTNLWDVLEHDKQYYTADGWGIHSSGRVYSVTFPVSENDRIYATSFGAGSVNGSGGTNGIRVTYFLEDGSVRSVAAGSVYSEFSANGYLTMPQGILAVSVPMWTVSDSNVLYILNRDHGFGNWKLQDQPGEKYRQCSICGYVESCALDPVENRLYLEALILNGGTSVWIDGKEFAVQTDGDISYVDLPDGNAKTMTVYTYGTDNGKEYPVSMKVWTLENDGGSYTATHQTALDDILQYAGSSIRVTGKKGIRMITAIDQADKTALTGDGLAGYTLKEYGTAIAWASQISDSKPLVLGKSWVKSNYAYKQGVADPVFAYKDGKMQYTNVLVNFSDAQCKKDIAMRPYMILADADGNEITLYGGIVVRSIGYIALQNKDTFTKGTEEYNYIWSIIRNVYGDAYDE